MNKLIFQLTTILFSIVLLHIGCANNEEMKDKPIELSENDSLKQAKMQKVIKIFYNVPSPLEMATVVQRDNAKFYTELLSPADDIDRFTTASRQALNIGVYGVDFSYAKLFNQDQESLTYLSAIKELSKKLGIPRDKAATSFDDIQKNVENSDTLLKIINETYQTADMYLKENQRESTATLIIVGGWIEALYIATNIYEKEENEDILNRIIVQKYSLNTLIELLSKHQDDKTVESFFEKMLMLKKVYDNIEIDFKKSDVNIDTVKKVIVLKGENPEITNKQIDDIKEIITKLRTAIIQ